MGHQDTRTLKVVAKFDQFPSSFIQNNEKLFKMFSTAVVHLTKFCTVRFRNVERRSKSTDFYTEFGTTRAESNQSIVHQVSCEECATTTPSIFLFFLLSFVVENDARECIRFMLEQ